MYIVKLDPSGTACGFESSPQSSTTDANTSTLTSPQSVQTVTSPAVESPSPTLGTSGTLTSVCTGLVSADGNPHQVPGSLKLFQNYPNPFNQSTTISYQLSVTSDVQLKVFDLLGRQLDVLVSRELKPGRYEVKWDGRNHPSGVYYYKLIVADHESGIKYVETKKMVMIK